MTNTKSVLKVDNTNTEQAARQASLRELPSAPFDPHLIASSRAIKALAFGLCAELEELATRKARTDAHIARMRFTECLLVNFFYLGLLGPSRYLAVKLDRLSYTDSAFSYSAVRAVMEGLVELGYIARLGHFWAPGKQTGIVTRFLATPTMLELLGGLTLSDVKIVSRKPLVELRPQGKVRRAAKKKGLECPTTLPWPNAQRKDRVRMSTNIKLINTALGNQFQAIALPDDLLMNALTATPRQVPLYRQAVHRVFITDTQHGGRFVGPWWQSIRRDFRQHIQMAALGEAPQATVELDFDSLHPAMLYATRGLHRIGDLYAVFNDKALNAACRPAIKLIFLTLINADSEASAKSSFRKKINTEDYPKWQLATYGEIADRAANSFSNVDQKLADMYPGCPPLNELFRTVIAHHSGIAEYFGSGAGRWLMFEDSQLAETVMLTLLRDTGMVPLPNHDSFIVPARLATHLRATMDSAFAKRFAGIRPAITQKGAKAAPTYNLDGSLYTRLLNHWVNPE